MIGITLSYGVLMFSILKPVNGYGFLTNPKRKRKEKRGLNNG